MKETWPKLRMPELPENRPRPSTAMRLVRNRVRVRCVAMPAPWPTISPTTSTGRHSSSPPSNADRRPGTSGQDTLAEWAEPLLHLQQPVEPLGHPLAQLMDDVVDQKVEQRREGRGGMPEEAGAGRQAEDLVGHL